VAADFAALAGRPDYTREQLLGFFREVGLAVDASDRRMFNDRPAAVQ
jgi:hypothetical protein